MKILKSVLALTFISASNGFADEKIELESLTKAEADKFVLASKVCVSEVVSAVRIRCTLELSEKYNIDIPDTYGLSVHGSWYLGSTKDLMTDDLTMVASAGIEVDEEEMALHIRCDRGKTDMFVSWPSTADMPEKAAPVDVQYRIGENTPKTETWRMAGKSDNVAFYNGDAAQFAKEIASGDRFAIEVASGVGVRAEVIPTDGLSEFIPDLNRECKW